ncbi:MAG: ABC transporter ATP-binding protein [Aestuariivirga sp.]
MNENEFLRLVDVTKRFGDVAVLRDINLSVASNEFLTILGPSGSGKTTILRLIGGFEQPSSGRIFIDGNDITNLPINQRPCNTVFQDYALFPHLSVRSNVGYGLMVRRTPAHVIDKKVKDVLEIVGLGPYTSRLPHELSGGQRQRVALARAIVCEPRVILLDEPLAALDVALRAQMCAFLKGLQRRLHIAFVFITHDQQEAIAMSDRIIVMDAGRIKQIGTPKQLYHEPNSRFVAEFFGENNIFEGTLVSAEGAVCKVETGFGRIMGRQAGEAAPSIHCSQPAICRIFKHC